MHTDSMMGPVALEHGWVPTPRYLMRRARILALARGLAPGDMLEIGCGAGMLLQEFAGRGFRCTAVESSAAALATARALALRACLSMDLRATPAPNWQKSFDLLCAFEVLEHIEDDRAALGTWAQWLRAGGRLLLSVPAHQRRWTAGDQWAGHYRRYERAQLLQLLDIAGFEVERLECYGYPLANLSEKFGARAYRKHIMAGSGDEAADRRANNDRSGVDRTASTRMYPLLNSLPGRALLSMCVAAQKLFLSTELGCGYVLRARCR
jgi:SAM-dependent methyltransferase